MMVINTVSNKRFSLNGTEYLRNYVSRTAGNRVEIFNNYERSDVLLGLTHYSDFLIDGATFTSAAAVQSALLPVIFSRGTLGNDVPEINQDNVAIKKTVNIEMTDTLFTILPKINALPTYTVNETNTIFFECIGIQDFYTSIVITYMLIGMGKGTYGIGGTQLTTANLQLINTVGGSDGAIATPSTQTINFSTTTTVWNWLNAQNPAVELQSQSEGYTIFKGAISGRDTSYLWIGEPGSYGVGETPRTQADFQLLDQTVQTAAIPLFRNFFFAQGQSAEPANAAQVLSTHVGLQGNLAPGSLPVVVSALNTPVMFQIQENIAGAITIYTYLFTGGVGSWGYNGEPISQIRLKLMGTRALTIPDIEDDVNTVTISLGTLYNDDFISPMNSESRNFSDADKTYYVVYNREAVDYTYRFIGVPGIYGADNAEFIEEMFASGPTSNTPDYVVPNINTVNMSGNVIKNQDTVWNSQEKSLIIGAQGLTHKTPNAKKVNFALSDIPDGNPSEITYSYPAKDSDDTFAMVSDIGHDLPEDFLISCMYDQINLGKFPIYYTDKWHQLPLDHYLGEGAIVYMTSKVITNGNDIIFFIQENNPIGYRGILLLKNCQIYCNKIKVSSFQYRRLVELNRDIYNEPYPVFDMLLNKKRDTIYLVTRQLQSNDLTYDNSNTQFFKVCSSNLNDIEVYELQNGNNFQGYVSHISSFKNYIYFIMGAYFAGGAYMCRITENFTQPEALFQIGTSTNERLSNGIFEIYNGEAYIPTIWNTSLGLNTIGLQVWDLTTKKQSRNVIGLPISSNATNRPAPFWINIFNGKVILHTAGNHNSNKALVRIDANSLELEEILPLGNQYSNLNTFDRQGWLYLGLQEFNLEGKRYKYNDFSLSEIISLPNGTPYYCCVGFPRYYPSNKSLKTKLSQFENDLPVVRTVNGLPPDSNGNFIIASAANVPLIIAAKGGLNAVVIGTEDGTTEKILATIEVLPNTIAKGILTFDAAFSFSATAVNGVKNLRLRTNTSNALIGAAGIAVAQATATARYTSFTRRIINFTGSALRSFGATGITEAGSSTAMTNILFDPAITNYFFITGTVTNAADDITLENFVLTNIKEIP